MEADKIGFCFISFLSFFVLFCFGDFIGAVSLHLLNSTVDFTETNIFLSFNFDKYFCIISTYFFTYSKSLSSYLCFTFGL